MIRTKFIPQSTRDLIREAEDEVRQRRTMTLLNRVERLLARGDVPVLPNPVDVEAARRELFFDWEEGLFYRLDTRGDVVSARPSGHVLPSGYVAVYTGGGNMLAHRVAWAWAYGEQPPEIMDHRNGVKHDNRLCNLRAATPAENARNRGMSSANTSGVTGVVKDGRGRWRAQIGVDGRDVYLGTYHTKAEAAVAYERASVEMHGEFSPFVCRS